MSSGARAAGAPGSERSPGSTSPAPGIVAWYTEGLTDGFGDRLLLFDNAAPGLELLRLHPGLTSRPGFERALRARVEQLADFRHAGFSHVRSLTTLDEPRPQLAIVSEMVPGERLSRVLQTARLAGLRPDPSAALWLVRQLLQGLAALHEHGGGLPHGVLTADRVTITPEGRVVIGEHVLGTAVETLGLDHAALWRDLGIATEQRGGRPRLDARTDVLQVALLGMAVLRGRPLGPHEYPEAVRRLLDEACERGPSSILPLVRTWLTRALTIESPSFASAMDAHDALDRLLPGLAGGWSPALLEAARSASPSAGQREPADPPARAKAARLEDRQRPPGAARVAPFQPLPAVNDGSRTWPRGTGASVTRAPALADTVSMRLPPRLDPDVPRDADRSQPAVPRRADVPAPPLADVDWPRETNPRSADTMRMAESTAAAGAFLRLAREEHAPSLEEDPSSLTSDPRVVRRLWWLSSSLALIAVAEAVCLVLLLVGRSGPSSPASPPAAVAQHAADPQPAEAPARAEVPDRSARGAGEPRAIGAPPAPGAAAEPAGDAPPAAAAGYVWVDSPVPVRVYANGRLLGPSARGRMRLPAGRHDIRLVNEDLQLNVRQEVAITSGQVTSIRPRVPRRR